MSEDPVETAIWQYFQGQIDCLKCNDIMGCEGASAHQIRTLLREAVARADSAGVWMAVTLIDSRNFLTNFLDELIELSFMDWHQSHEDVAFALATIHDPKSLNALEFLTTFQPAYLDHSDARALASKAIWGIAQTPGNEASELLDRIRNENPSPVVREKAQELAVLRERHGGVVKLQKR